MAPRPQRRTKAADAMKRCDNDPHVVSSAADGAPFGCCCIMYVALVLPLVLCACAALTGVCLLRLRQWGMCSVSHHVFHVLRLQLMTSFLPLPL